MIGVPALQKKSPCDASGNFASYFVEHSSEQEALVYLPDNSSNFACEL